MSINKLVVYTCLYGDRDRLNEQSISNNSSADFICFTDKKDLKSNSWKIKIIDHVSFEPERESRRAKAMPHLFLSGYDYSLYIDNTIKLNVPLENIINASILDSELIKVFTHPFRNCIYKEAEEVLWCGLDHEWRVWEQIEFYKSNKYPANNGLAAGCVILRKHNDPHVRRFGELWYEHILRFSKRDQLSLNYCAKAAGLDLKLFDGNLCDNKIVTYGMWEHELPPDFKIDEYSYLNNIPKSSAVEHYKQIGKHKTLKYRFENQNQIRTLFNKYKLDSGTLYGKRHSYCRIYSQFLESLKYSNAKVIILSPKSTSINYSTKISLSNLWKEYFTNARIYNLHLDNYKIYAKKCMQRMGCLKIDKRPIVIFDYSNTTVSNQLLNLQFHIRFLKPGGLCFIEYFHKENLICTQSLLTKTFSTLLLIIRNPNLLYNPLNTILFFLNVLLSKFHYYDSMNSELENLGEDSFLAMKKFHVYLDFYLPLKQFIKNLPVKKD